MTEGMYDDHLTVRWQLPGGSVEDPIAVEHLRPWGYSFDTEEPPVLRISSGAQGSGVHILLEWEGNGVLLEAPAVNGPWESIETGSPFTVMPGDENRFFRLRSSN